MTISEANAIIGRESYFDYDTRIVKQEYSDSRRVVMPVFMERLVKSPYRNKGLSDLSADIMPDEVISKYDLVWSDDASKKINIKDLQTASLMVGDIGPLYKQLCDSITLAHEEHDLGYYSEKLRSTYSYLEPLFEGHLVANIKELNKRQILVNAPTWHHGCSDGDHFNHKAALPDSIHNTLHKAGEYLGDYFVRTFGKREAKTDFTLPLMTSQGLLLKSSHDSPRFRAISKALQGAYALKCKNEEELYELIDKLNSLNRDYGYDFTFDSFTLALRSQQASKPEQVDLGDSNCDVTMGMQGRTRGILITIEMLKVYYKGVSDTNKLTLFHETYLCSVDPVKIKAKQLLSIENYVHNLIASNDDGQTVPRGYHDLSAMDRNTNQSLGNAYQQFCRRFIAGWDGKFKKNFQYCEMIFPHDCGKYADVIQQKVLNRSTLSGQPDVTVKNNIVHIVILSLSLTAILNNIEQGASPSDLTIDDLDDLRPSDEALDMLILGKKNDKLPDFVAAIHGDDAFLNWKGMTNAHADFIHKTFDWCGIPCAEEDSLVYLKKTMNLELLSKALLNSNHDSNSVFRLNTAGLTDDERENLICNIDGSLVKNRFGEYPVIDAIVGMVSYLDTLSKLSIHGFNKSAYYWGRMLMYYDSVLKPEELEEIDDELRSNINILAKELMLNSSLASDYWDCTKALDMQMRSIGLRNALSVSLNNLYKDKSLQATQLRHTLSRLFYSSMEQFDDEVLEQIYGSMFYEASDIRNDTSLSNMTREEIAELILDMQKRIYDSDGMFTLSEDDLTIGDLLFERMK